MSSLDRARKVLEYVKTAQEPIGTDAAIGCALGMAETEVGDALSFLEASALIQIERQIHYCRGRVVA